MKDQEARNEIILLKSRIDGLERKLQHQNDIMVSFPKYPGGSPNYASIQYVLMLFLRHFGLNLTWVDAQEGHATLIPKEEK